jgi:hypothetical protein
MGAPSQALQIVFELQSQKSSQKIAIKNICFFQITKCVFFSF